jgi:hypothetical protein
MVRNRSGLLLAIVAMQAGFAAGCRTVSKGITETVLEHEQVKQWRVHYGSRTHYILSNDTMKDVEFEGTLNVGDTIVRYQRGLTAQAQCVAEKTAGLLDAVRERTGIAVTTRTTMYLLRFDQKPQNFDIMLAVEPNEFPLPLFVVAGDESCESILIQNRSYPYLVVHELVETSLAGGKRGGVVLPDLSWGFLGLTLHANNYTRWFRDGMANYAGLIAYRALSGTAPGDHTLQYREMLLHAYPFSSLAQIGPKLFRWVQSSGGPEERNYYNAALGLFLFIEDQFGPAAIRNIVAEIGRHDVVDGRDLLAITRQVLGTDIRQVVEDFEFPQLRMELERMTPALALNKGLDLREGLCVMSIDNNGVAGKAGLKANDVVTAVGATPIVHQLDFELALFKARKQQSVALAVQRQPAQTLSIELPLHRPEARDATEKSPGKRHRRLKKGSSDSPLLATF